MKIPSQYKIERIWVPKEKWGRLFIVYSDPNKPQDKIMTMFPISSFRNWKRSTLIRYFANHIQRGPTRERLIHEGKVFDFDSLSSPEELIDAVKGALITMEL